ncbi:hypothetical protein GCM10010517_66350 [Streptosporangium fragile]|uniref:Lipoprotein n=2 Tax=Streptosporangium fragile TaxID=46186 RepID=A0ABP6IP63_9ACTN
MKIKSMLVAAAALTACLTGCASAEDAPAEDAARQFYAAVQGRDGERACALLAPEAAESLRTGSETCAAAVVGLDLPGGDILGVQVWGDEAQVRMTRDTVFLHRFPKGWLVRGAGCEPRGDLPYDCEVKT